MSELLKINVNDHTEKKGHLTYLSWAWAWAEILKIDPLASWQAAEFNGLPFAVLPDTTAMVKVFVTVKGDTKSSWLPVMDNRNKAIVGPDAFAINTAIMRCLAKAIAMHGLGLYIYAGEDLPEDDGSARVNWIADRIAAINAAKTSGEMKRILEDAITITQQKGDHDAESQLREAALEKVRIAKEKA